MTLEEFEKKQIKHMDVVIISLRSGRVITTIFDKLSNTKKYITHCWNWANDKPQTKLTINLVDIKQIGSICLQCFLSYNAKAKVQHIHD